MNFLGRLFGADSAACLENIDNALIVDVRTPREYAAGHVRDSINIPLDKIGNSVVKLEKAGQPIVLCCASGARSGRATQLLKNRGIECCNGGSWLSVNQAKR